MVSPPVRDADVEVCPDRLPRGGWNGDYHNRAEWDDGSGHPRGCPRLFHPADIIWEVINFQVVD